MQQRHLCLTEMFFVFALAACSGMPETTAGKRVILASRLDAMPEAAAPFANAKGWRISLSEARMSAGPFYYFEGSVLLAESTPPIRPLWHRALGIRDAWAHPGHYIPGQARGEMLTPSDNIDLRAGVVALATGAGVSGSMGSATFTFGAPDPGRAVIRLSGTATKGAIQRVFSAKVMQSELLNANGASRVEGCPFEPVNLQQDGTVVVHVSLSVWFDQVEFQDVPEGSEAAPTELVVAMVAHNALLRGIKASDGYLFKFTKESP